MFLRDSLEAQKALTNIFSVLLVSFKFAENISRYIREKTNNQKNI